MCTKVYDWQFQLFVIICNIEIIKRIVISFRGGVQMGNGGGGHIKILVILLFVQYTPPPAFILSKFNMSNGETIFQNQHNSSDSVIKPFLYHVVFSRSDYSPLKLIRYLLNRSDSC